MKKLSELNKPNYELVKFPEGNRVSSDKAEFIHRTCGNHISISLSQLRKNSNNDKGCTFCSGHHRYTLDEVSEIVNREKDPYTVLGIEYINRHLCVHLRHNRCGNEYTTSFYQFNGMGQRCPACKGGVRKSPNTFKREVYELVGDEYTLLSEYENSHKHVKIKHNKCNSEYLISPTAFLGGKRCPVCNESHGEQKVAHYLDTINEPYIRQHKFKDCIYKSELPFDFYLPLKNILIEYDGEQHYKPIPHFGGVERYRIRKLRDSIKTNFANENNIRLVRIPYYLKDNEIYNVIKKELDS